MHQASLSFTVSQNVLNPCPLSRWCHPTISSSLTPFLLLPSIFPSIRVFSSESALHIRWPKYWSFSFSIQWIFRVDFLLNWLILSPCCPRNSQESSPAPQFESINSSALSLLYGPSLRSLGDYWRVVFLKIRLSETPPSNILALWMST